MSSTIFETELSYLIILFLLSDDNNKDIFVHQTAIVKNNPDKYLRSVGDKEPVQFDVVQGLFDSNV